MGPATAGAVATAGSTSAALAGMGTAGGLLSGLGGLSALTTGMSLFSGLSSVMGGIQGNAAAQEQSNYAMASATMAGREQARLAVKEAGIEKEESDAARRRQKIAYLASGVTLEGSPFLIMEETRRKGAENVDEILTAGASGTASTMTEGRMLAQQYKSSGRTAFASGITSGISSLTTAFQ